MFILYLPLTKLHIILLLCQILDLILSNSLAARALLHSRFNESTVPIG